MANPAVDWTVDKLLAAVDLINDKMASAGEKIHSNRAAYTATLRSLPSIQNVAAREALRARLGAWIPKQVADENRFNQLSAQYRSAKARAKSWLENVGITPPGYLSGAVLVPVIVYGALAALLIAATAMVVSSFVQGKAMDCITNVTRAAVDNHWSEAQTADALRTCKIATDATTPDPGGIRATLDAAVPALALIAGLVIFGPMLKRRFA